MSEYIPYDKFQWPEPGPMFEVTCKNHPTARYLTKGPARGLHFIEGAVEFGPWTECPCSGTDLVVVIDEACECLDYDNCSICGARA